MLEFLYTGDYAAELPSVAVETEAISLSKAHSIFIDATTGKNLSIEETQSQWVAVLKTHALVYQLSDMLGIDDLRHEAYNRFEADYDSSVVLYEGFADLLTLIFTTTSPSDEDLRGFVVKRCIVQHDDIKGSEALEAVLKSYEPMAWVTGVALQKEIDSLNQTSDDAIAVMQEGATRERGMFPDFSYVPGRTPQGTSFNFAPQR